ncbi:2'-5' RNA ligase family protein [Planococcus alpniumensis]|uniref:2'-5' RNA ligase family protein n=1 Tax=Planococcus alpniumensis TaxID=2708345 RepID=UPI001B8D109F|nr:2'-5' RNA ligase family protein [Planococcus sp. MSAK28401]
MQLLVLRLDYRSSTTIENLQRQLRQPNSKLALQLPHIPLLIFEKTAPHHLKAALEPIAQKTAPPSFHASDIGFSKDGARFYLQVHPNEALGELYSSLKLAAHEYSNGADVQWQPHVPLIGKVPAPFWGPLFARLALEFDHLDGTAVALECWSVIGDRTTIEWSLFLKS